MDAYSLNPQMLPGKPLSNDEHRRMIATLIVVVIVAAVVGIGYWWSLSQPRASDVDQQALMRDRVVSILSSTDYHASPEDVNRIAASLTASKSAPATDAEKESVVRKLNASSAEY
jgi:type IV secretory pathway VirB10-like protein